LLELIFLVQYVIIPLALIIWIVAIVSESIERKNNERIFKEILAGTHTNNDSIEIEKRGEKTRKKQLYKSQKENCSQIGEVIKKDLIKFKKDLTPRLYEYTLKYIDDHINQTNFRKLFDLYEFLKGLKNNTAQNEIARFVKFN
jgi:hypothetical protein